MTENARLAYKGAIGNSHEITAEEFENLKKNESRRFFIFRYNVILTRFFLKVKRIFYALIGYIFNEANYNSPPRIQYLYSSSSSTFSPF